MKAMRGMILLLSVLLQGPLWCADPAGAPSISGNIQPLNLPLFSEGLHSRYSENAIPDNSLSEALNIVLDEDADGIPVVRRGYSQYCDIGSDNIRGTWIFDDTGGTRYIVFVASGQFYQSPGDGTCTAITGASGYSDTAEWDCATGLGRIACLNGSTVWDWDGTSTRTVTAAPAGTMIEFWRNRFWISGFSGGRTRVRASGELDLADWTTGSQSTSPVNIDIRGTNDGKEIVCLMPPYQDVFPVAVRDELHGIYGFGRNDFVTRVLSKEVGCIEDKTAREKNNSLYWLSQRGMEKWTGNSLDRISDPIRDAIDDIIGTTGNLRRKTDTSQSDFEAGLASTITASGPGAPTSTTINPGNVVVSSWTDNDNSTAEFSSGTLTNTSTLTVNSVVPEVTDNADFIHDSFADGELTANPTWTCDNGVRWNVSAGRLQHSGSGAASYCESTLPIQMNRNTRKSVVFQADINVLDNTSSQDQFASIYGAAGAYVFRSRNIGGITATLAFCKTSTFNTPCETVLATFSGQSLANHTMKIDLSSNGVAGFYIDNVFQSSVTDAQYTSFSTIRVIGAGGSGSTFFDNFRLNYSTRTSNFVSRIFSVALSTPVPGIFSADITSSANAAITFQVQSSTADDGGGFESLISQSTGAVYAGSSLRFWRYRANFSLTIDTGTAVLTAITLSARTTAYFIGDCINPGANITAWGNLGASVINNGGSVTLSVSSGTTCNAVTRATATWTTQTNNTVIGIATASFLGYRVLFNLDVGTDNPTMQDITANWENGASRPPSAVAVYKDAYYLAFTSDTASGANNDHILRLDKNDKWTLWNNHFCYSLALYERTLKCGNADGSGKLWTLDTGYDDDGAAFTARLRTKAFDFGDPYRQKLFDRVYLILEPEGDPSDSIIPTLSYSLDRSTRTFSLGSVDLGEDDQHILVPKFPFSLSNPTSGRYLTLQLESSGTKHPWRLFGGQIFYKPLRRD